MPFRDLIGRTIALDTCCALNIYGSGCISEILSAYEAEFCIEGYVLRNESGHIWTFEQRPEKVPQVVDMQPLVASGLLSVVEIDDTEALTAISLASQNLDDGEARTAAVAIHRGFVVATDDGAARRLLRAQHQPVEVIGTPGLMRAWAEAREVDAARVKAVLEEVEFCGNYVPSSRDPDSHWWTQSIGR